MLSYVYVNLVCIKSGITPTFYDKVGLFRKDFILV